MSKKTTLANALLLFGSILFCLAIFMIGELATRHFSNITFLGHSKNLFIPNAYGVSSGNAKNIEAVAFGAKVYTDQHGFRVPEHPTDQSKASNRNALLILGDSVAFGLGLEEGKTFSGMLRASFPEMEVYNSSVSGYSTRDYRNVVEFFPLAEKKVVHVLLLFCLNDISSESAKEIQEFTNVLKNEDGKHETIEKNLDGPTSSGQINQLPIVQEQSWMDVLREYEIFSSVNDFLRSRSKFYILLKGLLSDPQKRYWEHDYRLYQDTNHAGFLSHMQDITDVAATLREKSISFTVILVPYEFQMRNPVRENLLPQRKLQDYFDRHSIDTIDSTPWFGKKHTESKKFFLALDPMHLSEQGNEIVHSLIVDRLGPPIR